MGREVRRVPKGWEHPREMGPYGIQSVPLRDEDFETALAEWEATRAGWVREKHECSFEEYHGPRPRKSAYRPKWTEEERTCFQVYETVTEGTPTSPVFESEVALVGWLVSQGHSEAAAAAFVEDGWAPSFVIIPSLRGAVIRSGIDAAVRAGHSVVFESDRRDPSAEG